MDEKWKLSKKGSRNASRSASSSSSANPNASMMRCSSTATGRTTVAGAGTSEAAMLKRSDSVPSRSKFSRKCASLVKEQRAKFYIVRRCVTMLVCWKDYRDS